MYSYDAIIVGGGPAGCTAAIRLAAAGWSVALVEKRRYPRRKVCGECIAASNLELLERLGVGAEFDALAGPELRRVGLFVEEHRIIAPLPPLAEARHAWGRALGREHLDTLLLRRARSAGAHIWQPFAARKLEREGIRHRCRIRNAGSGAEVCLESPVLIHAHGSWEPDPDATTAGKHRPHRDHDLFAFKGTYRNACIEPGILPVLAFPGGYGGMVLGDHGLTTLAFCVRRDVLRRERARNPGMQAAGAALAYVEKHCAGVQETLLGAEATAAWLSVGPLQPGIRAPWREDETFAIGNVAGEAHPILGEGISMAIQSAWLLCDQLIGNEHELRGDSCTPDFRAETGRAYATLWRRSLAGRIRFAAVCAHLAMRPHLSKALLPVFQRIPTILTRAARIGGKVKPLTVATGARPLAFQSREPGSGSEHETGVLS